MSAPRGTGSQGNSSHEPTADSQPQLEPTATGTAAIRGCSVGTHPLRVVVLAVWRTVRWGTSLSWQRTCCIREPQPPRIYGWRDQGPLAPSLGHRNFRFRRGRPRYRLDAGH